METAAHTQMEGKFPVVVFINWSFCTLNLERISFSFLLGGSVVRM